MFEHSALGIWNEFVFCFLGPFPNQLFSEVHDPLRVSSIQQRPFVSMELLSIDMLLIHRSIRQQLLECRQELLTVPKDSHSRGSGIERVLELVEVDDDARFL